MFIRPGISHLPAIGTTLAPAGTATDAAGPTCRIFSPCTSTTAFGVVRPLSTSTTLPPTNAVTGAASCAVTALADTVASAASAVRQSFIASLPEDGARLRDLPAKTMRKIA